MPDKPSRVLMTADAIGGVWTYALELVRGLQACNVQVILAVMGGGVTGCQRAEASALNNLILRESDAKLEWMDQPWDDVRRAGGWLLELEAEFNPDVIHLNGYAHAAVKFHAPSILVAHSCVLSWFRAVRGTAAPFEWNCYRENVRRGLDAAHLVIAPTRAMLNALKREHGPVPFARVIPNGCDWPKPRARAKSHVILGAGRIWDEAKNYRVLETCATALQWPVVLAGDFGQRAPAGVHATGKLSREELLRWYERAAVFALPALYEPFGYTVLEAGLNGCALVLSDIESLRENWDGCALFVDPRDTGAWRDRLNSLPSDPTRVELLAKRAQERALLFNRRLMTSSYLAAYEEVLRNHAVCELRSSATAFNPTGTTETLTSSAA